MDEQAIKTRASLGQERQIGRSEFLFQKTGKASNCNKQA